MVLWGNYCMCSIFLSDSTAMKYCMWSEAAVWTPAAKIHLAETDEGDERGGGEFRPNLITSKWGNCCPGDPRSYNYTRKTNFTSQILQNNYHSHEKKNRPLGSGACVWQSKYLDIKRSREKRGHVWWTYLVAPGKKAHGKCAQVVLAPRGHTCRWPSGSAVPAWQRRTESEWKTPGRTEACRPARRSAGGPRNLRRCTWSWRRWIKGNLKGSRNKHLQQQKLVKKRENAER